MGVILRYLKATCKPIPQPATVTIGAVSHVLMWLDRNSGYRLGCSCGWADDALRWSERRAIEVGNGHIRAVKFAALRRVSRVG